MFNLVCLAPNYQFMGTSELLSVSYSINSGSVILTSPGGENYEINGIIPQSKTLDSFFRSRTPRNYITLLVRRSEREVGLKVDDNENLAVS